MPGRDGRRLFRHYLDIASFKRLAVPHTEMDPYSGP